MRKLNVGCGKDYREGWINLDFDKKVRADVFYDLNKIYCGGRLPFKNNTFDLIILYDILEHFPEPLPILRELYRVSKIGGIIEIKVPYGDWTWINLDHKRIFFLNSFELNNFDYDNTTIKKKVELIERKLYTLPSRNFLKILIYKIFLSLINPLKGIKSSLYDQTLLRFIFQKTNIHVKYRKVT